MTIITNDVVEAAEILRGGGLVAVPTETVYGLAADANNETAIRSIFNAKNRPLDHPLIVHLADIDQLVKWAKNIPKEAYLLAQQFWPGPLTLILEKQAHVLDIVTGGQATIGIRVPRHPVALALLRAFGSGLAAPSANQFTHISPTTEQAVMDELSGRIDLILEGGDCEVGLESTILDLTTEMPTILRPGMITAPMISRCLNRPVIMQHIETTQKLVPGMHQLHYAPETRTRLVTEEALATLADHIEAAQLPLVLIIHEDAFIPDNFYHKVIVLPNDPGLYAHALYRTLRQCDQGQFKTILIAAVPATPEWEAIHDRITKASFPR